MSGRSQRSAEPPAWWRLLAWPVWRLALEPVRREHTAAVRRALTAEIAGWLGVGTVAEMRAGTAVWASEADELARLGEAYRYLVYREGRFAGAIEVRPDAVRGHIGYWLRRGERGQGTITLANRLILLIGFEGIGLKAVDWTADAGNAASVAVMRRLGAERVDLYPVRNVPGRTNEIRFRLTRRTHVPDPSGPEHLRELLRESDNVRETLRH